MNKTKTGILVLLFMVPFLAFGFDLKSEYDILVEEAQEGTVDNAINADEINFEKTPINKLGRGSLNVLTCWGELLAEFFNVSRDKDPVAGLTIGFSQGIVTSLYRGGSGLYDIFTFASPPYDKPPMKPEYTLQHVDDSFESFTAKSRLFGGD